MNTPLHPLIVHFPIAMLLLGVIAQIVAFWKRDFFDKLATYLFTGGLITGIAAYVSGEEGERFAKIRFGATKSLIETHAALALATLLVFGVIAALKLIRSIRQIRAVSAVVLVLSLIGGGLIAATGHYGGKIVYNPEGAVQQNPAHENE